MDISFKGFIWGLGSGVAFGLIMSFTLVTLHCIFSLKFRKLKGTDISAVVQKKFMELDLSFDNVYDECIKSITAVKKCEIESEDRKSGEIKALTSLSWKSFGENIQFKIWSSENGRTRIQILSRPKLKTTLVDYGKNIENVLKLSSFLSVTERTGL
jgi:superfamily I DNA and/or RNA helicase